MAAVAACAVAFVLAVVNVVTAANAVFGESLLGVVVVLLAVDLEV